MTKLKPAQFILMMRRFDSIEMLNEQVVECMDIVSETQREPELLSYAPRRPPNFSADFNHDNALLTVHTVDVDGRGGGGGAWMSR